MKDHHDEFNVIRDYKMYFCPMHFSDDFYLYLIIPGKFNFRIIFLQ